MHPADITVSWDFCSLLWFLSFSVFWVLTSERSLRFKGWELITSCMRMLPLVPWIHDDWMVRCVSALTLPCPRMYVLVQGRRFSDLLVVSFLSCVLLHWSLLSTLRSVSVPKLYWYCSRWEEQERKDSLGEAWAREGRLWRFHDHSHSSHSSLFLGNWLKWVWVWILPRSVRTVSFLSCSFSHMSIWYLLPSPR